MDKPRCVVLAGPNGGGKSTLYTALPPTGPFINADLIARRIDRDNPENASLRAGREAIVAIDRQIAARSDFTFETTLSSSQSLSVLRKAGAAGFDVSLLFVALSSADLHVMRVRQRVSQGGHRIADHVIRRRCARSIDNLSRAIPLAAVTVFFDNSRSLGLQQKLVIEGVDIVFNALDRTSAFHRQIAVSVAAGLQMAPDMVMSAGRR
jgi:predicted ABC-type ATPase